MLLVLTLFVFSVVVLYYFLKRLDLFRKLEEECWSFSKKFALGLNFRMAEAEVEQQPPPPAENGLQWTLGDDDSDDRSEQSDTFAGGKTTPAEHHGLSAAHLAALQEKRKRLK